MNTSKKIYDKSTEQTEDHGPWRWSPNSGLPHTEAVHFQRVQWGSFIPVSDH